MITELNIQDDKSVVMSGATPTFLGFSLPLLLPLGPVRLPTSLLVLPILIHGELLLLHLLQLVTEVELGSLLLELGELVFVLGHLLQSGLHAGEKGDNQGSHLVTFRGNVRHDIICTLMIRGTYNLPRKSLTWILSSLI